MPIPITKLQKAQEPLRSRILEFLSEQSKQAFTAVEVYGALQGLNEVAVGLMTMAFDRGELHRMLDPVQNELTALEEEGVVQSAMYSGTRYYAIREQQ